MTYAARTIHSPQSFQMSSFAQPMSNNTQVNGQSPANDAGMRNSNRSIDLSQMKTASVLPRATSTRSDKVGHRLMNGLTAIGLGGVGAATYLAFNKASVAVPMTLSTVGTAGLACVTGAAVSAGLAVYNAARSCVPSKRLNESLNAQFKGTDKLIAHFESGQIKYNAEEQKFELNSNLMTQQDMHHFENEFLHNKHGQTLFGSHIGETRVKDMLNKINQNIHVASNADEAYATAAKTMNKELKYSQTRKIVTTAALSTAAGGAAGAIAGGLGAPIGAAIGLAFGLLGAKGGHVAYKKMTADNTNRMAAAAQTQGELHANPSLVKVLHNLNTYSYKNKVQEIDHNEFRAQLTPNLLQDIDNNLSPALHNQAKQQIQRYCDKTEVNHFSGDLSISDPSFGFGFGFNTGGFDLNFD